jgi:endonuclease-3
MSQATQEKIEKIIHSTGFYKNKAKNILNCSKTLVEKFDGSVPAVMDELILLDGVGRKTANVVLGNAFGLSEGIVVDTHVKRISNLLKLTKQSDPEKIEKDLMKLFHQKHWTNLSHLFIFLGRRVCVARRPQCSKCCLKDICPSAQL